MRDYFDHKGVIWRARSVENSLVCKARATALSLVRDELPIRNVHLKEYEARGHSPLQPHMETALLFRSKEFDFVFKLGKLRLAQLHDLKDRNLAAQDRHLIFAACNQYHRKEMRNWPDSYTIGELLFVSFDGFHSFVVRMKRAVTDVCLLTSSDPQWTNFTRAQRCENEYELISFLSTL